MIHGGGPCVIKEEGRERERERERYPRAGLFKWARHSVGNGFGKRASLLSVQEGIFRA